MTNKKLTLSERTVIASDKLAAASPLVYSPAPGWATPGSRRLVASDVGSGPGVATGTALATASSRSPDENIRVGEDETREQQGFREGLAQARTESEVAVKHHQDAIAEALREFSHERDAYYHHVEGEVVALALAIVRKILRRESLVDPLLLSGLVRVALEKSSSSHTARLRVSPSQLVQWQEYFLARTDLPLTPVLEGDPALEADQCHLETDFGATDISVETQLKEIEKGLLDLLAQRPPPR